MAFNLKLEKGKGIYICGLFGFDLQRVQLSNERKVALTAVLAAGNDTRGGDSWGYWGKSPNKADHKIDKGLGDIAKQVLKMSNIPILMAHCRKATQGAVSVPNCHPFEINNVIGAHNGIISNHTELNRKYSRDFEVDSMHIFKHLSEGRELEDIHGYGTIEFVRKEYPSRIYLCKLSGELHVWAIGKEKNCRAVIWSSDNDHLKAALTAANIAGYTFEVKSGQLYYVENGQFFEETDTKLSMGSSINRNWSNEHYTALREGFESDDSSDKRSDRNRFSRADNYKALWDMNNTQLEEAWKKDEEEQEQKAKSETKNNEVIDGEVITTELLPGETLIYVGGKPVKKNDIHKNGYAKVLTENAASKANRAEDFIDAGGPGALI